MSDLEDLMRRHWQHVVAYADTRANLGRCEANYLGDARLSMCRVHRDEVKRESDKLRSVVNEIRHALGLPVETKP